jgi:hypothetical protein
MAGMSSRFVRSPEAPKMTRVQSVGGAPLAPAAADWRIKVDSGMVVLPLAG